MMASRRLVSRHLVLSLTLLLALNCARAQSAQPQPQPVQPQPAQPSQGEGGTIHGMVKSGNMPIPGAEVYPSRWILEKEDLCAAIPVQTGQRLMAATLSKCPPTDRMTLRYRWSRLPRRVQKVAIDSTHQNGELNFEMTLLSRTQEPGPRPRTQNAQLAAAARVPNAAGSAEHDWPGRRRRAQRHRAGGYAGSGDRPEQRDGIDRRFRK